MVIVKDTIKLPLKGKKVTIFVREMGTLRPAVNCPILLFTRHSAAFYATFYLRYDSLGTTDAQGKLEWQWNGDSLPGNTYLGFSQGIYYDGAKVEYVGPVPANSYEGWILMPGTVRLKIEIKKDSLPFSGVELVQYRTGNYQQTPNWDQRAFFSVKKLPFDTTITLTDLAPATFTYGIRYGLDNSSYQSYLYSPKTKQFTINFKPADTLYQYLVIE